MSGKLSSAIQLLISLPRKLNYKFLPRLQRHVSHNAVQQLEFTDLYKDTIYKQLFDFSKLKYDTFPSLCVLELSCNVQVHFLRLTAPMTWVIDSGSDDHVGTVVVSEMNDLQLTTTVPT